jgi:hypothetical protein
MKKGHFVLSLVALCSIGFSQYSYAENSPPSGSDSGGEPLLKERVHINDLINEARKRNIGVQAYVTQMEAIEDKAFNGAPEAELKPMVDDLTAKLNGQLRESVELKNYRPAPLTAAQQKELSKWKRSKDKEERLRVQNANWNEHYTQTRYANEVGTRNSGHSNKTSLIKSESFTDSQITQKIKSDNRYERQRAYSSTDMVLKDPAARKAWQSLQNAKATGARVTTIIQFHDPTKE